MRYNIPPDIRGEAISNYFRSFPRKFQFLGNHKRNAYEDILSVVWEDDAVRIDMSRQGLYDMLPEALFHPVDRFDHLPANEYKERFVEEVERLQVEESDARTFFAPYDRFIFKLNSMLAELKDSAYSDNSVITDIICDSLPERYRDNRLVHRTLQFIPLCRDIRGDATLISLMLRKVMSDEGLRLEGSDDVATFCDEAPRYNSRLQQDVDSPDMYLGNIFDENVLRYKVRYWDDESCDESFLNFVEEIRVFEEFINDYFMGIETSLHIDVSTQGLPVRLSDDVFYNYLNYNTNL